MGRTRGTSPRTTKTKKAASVAPRVVVLYSAKAVAEYLRVTYGAPSPTRCWTRFTLWRMARREDALPLGQTILQGKLHVTARTDALDAWASRNLLADPPATP